MNYKYLLIKNFIKFKKISENNDEKKVGGNR